LEGREITKGKGRWMKVVRGSILESKGKAIRRDKERMRKGKKGMEGEREHERLAVQEDEGEIEGDSDRD
jgi:hypothetical protein